MERAPQGFDVEAFDEYIYPQFARAKVSVLSDVKPDKKCLTEVKADFIAGKIKEPVLTYEKNKDTWYDEPEIILLDLKNELTMRYDIPEFIREQYIWAINEKIAKIRMLRETQAVTKGGDVEYHMKRFQRYADFIYGQPEPKIFNDVIQRIEHEITVANNQENNSSEVIEARKKLLEIINRYKVDNPYSDSLQNINIDDRKSDEEIVTNAEDLKKIFENALVSYGLNDWKVTIDKSGTRTAIAVSGDGKKVLLPTSEKLTLRSKKRQLTLSMIKGLIAHEIGTHALRKKNGQKSSILLLGSGLDRYEQGEEGLATYREQNEQPTSEPVGLDAYFAIGLAKGMDGAPKRNFTEVFEILVNYYLVTENTDIARAKELAWSRCERIFRGTTGTVPGVVFLKDLMYRHGNISHWKAVANGSLDGIDLDSGKFDPTNPRHTTFLNKLKELNKVVNQL